jgi:hypothetical protein
VKSKWTLAATITGILLLFLAGSCALLFNAIRLKPPKQAVLLQNFKEHRAAYEQLRDMLLADTNLERVASWGIDQREPFCLGQPTAKVFSMNRYAKYQSLLKEIGGGMAFRRAGEKVEPKPGVCIWGWGFGGDTRHISICWLNQTPTNLIPILDGYRSGNVDGEAYCHIDSNWYFLTDL